MYIKSVVIDGFKSYAQRTEINGFDPLFNAITGLNGSGKSNILDAICFLLGITNLAQVRAASLQELVYKNGQAGITKATVSVTFDNSNKDQSPLGYEQYDELTITRQVVVGGRNKYLINGSNANNTRVQDLFRSVQLNINNPHFLIMQGRITKVLNMKPLEILSMIEEAAGTRLYESKKESAQRTIAKKDAKLNEIDTVLKEEITPTLSSLREERSSYLSYQKVLRELDHLTKFCVAYQFVSIEDQRLKSSGQLEEIHQSIETLKGKEKECAEKIVELDAEIKELQEKKDREAGGTIRLLEAELNDAQKLDTKAQSNLSHEQEMLQLEEKKQTDLHHQQKTDEGSLASSRTQLTALTAALTGLQAAERDGQVAVSSAQKHFHAVSAGLATNQDGGEDASLSDQLIAAKKEISNATTEIKQSQMKQKHSQQELKKREADLKKTDGDYKKDQATFDAAAKSVTKLKAEMTRLSYEEGQEEEMTGRRRTLAQQVQQLKEKVDTLEARFPQLQFQYRDPQRDFDRRRVHGLVAKLITVKDVSAATALEVSAGGKLYHVVVDTQLTGKSLLQHGQLKRRYTIIPLNKIVSRTIDTNTVKKAENLVGRQNVRTALSLVGFRVEVEAAIKFVFGDSFICPDMETAKTVTFNEGVMKKSVTVDGDVFNPTGTLTGGARAQTSSILLRLGELREAQDALAARQEELSTLDATLTTLNRVAQRWRQLKQECDLVLQEMELAEGKLEDSTHRKQLDEIAELQATIDGGVTLLAEAEARRSEAEGRVLHLERKMADASGERERELAVAEGKVAAARGSAQRASKAMKDKQQEVDSMQLEVCEFEKELAGYADQLTAGQDTAASLQHSITHLSQTATNTKAAAVAVQERLSEQRALLKACNTQLSSRLADQQTAKRDANTAQLRLQEMEHRLGKMTRDSRDAARQVEQMLKQHKWIVDEKQYFGQTGTSYDFTASDPKEAGRRATKLEAMRDKLSRSVNMRAMTMLGKAEEQYNDLMKKRKVVFNDKMQIMAVIAELDVKKNEALKTAHLQVNKDFGSIFSTLLPGTSAKLVAPNNQSILDGLEVHVAFSGVWKESLNELSGGQRSLVALSLILALLLFKPAPLYILDEVDAALDLSHTQNIGRMLRTHFKHSQFIVVSLKEGMFNNANVLYKTRFIDGVSTVTRYAQSQTTARAAPTSAASSTATPKAVGQRKKTSKRARLGDIA